MNNLDHAVLETQHTRELTIKVIFLLIICLTAGMLFYHFVEDLGFVDALYFAAMTLTTVGYGDFVPTTDVGKLFTTLYAFIGIGIFFGFANVLFKGAVARSMRKTIRKRMEAEQASQRNKS